MQPSREQLALFIDYENVSGVGLNATWLLRALEQRGNVSLSRAYGDWSRLNSHRRRLEAGGIDLIDLPGEGRAGKNSADLQLSVDALELALTDESVTVFAIFSADTDFRPLICRLRDYGRQVLLISPHRTVSSRLQAVCDESISYEDLVEPAAQRSPELADVLQLLKSALEQLDFDDGSLPTASAVSGMLRDLAPDLNLFNLGFNRFRDLLDRAEQAGVIRRVRFRGVKTELIGRPDIVGGNPDVASCVPRFQRVYVRIGPHFSKAQMLLFPPAIHGRVLRAVHDELSEGTGPIRMANLLNAVCERLRGERLDARMSRTKVRRVLRTVSRSGCLIVRSGGGPPGGFRLSPDCLTFSQFRKVHDLGVVRFLERKGIALSESEKVDLFQVQDGEQSARSPSDRAA